MVQPLIGICCIDILEETLELLVLYTDFHTLYLVLHSTHVSALPYLCVIGLNKQKLSISGFVKVADTIYEIQDREDVENLLKRIINMEVGA